MGIAETSVDFNAWLPSTRCLGKLGMTIGQEVNWHLHWYILNKKLNLLLWC